MRTRRPVGRGLRWLVFLALVVLPFLAPTPASAHSLLVSSTPADGQSYDRPPSDVRLVFSENVNVAATSVRLFDGDGNPIDVEQPRAEGGAPEATVIDIPLTTLASGAYLLRWQTISSDDLHPTAGSLVFGIGVGVSPAGAQDPSPGDRVGGVAEALLRWIAVLCLGFALAVLLLTRQLARRGAAVAGRLVRSTVLATTIGATATFALGVLYLVRIAAVAGFLPLISAWSFTLRWLLACLLAGAAWSMLRTGRGTRTPSGRLLSWLLLALSIVAISAIGHPAAVGPLTVVVGAVHTLSTVIWTGGALAVAMIAVPALRRHDRVEATEAARAFTPIAGLMVPISLLTGLFLAGQLVPSVGALVNTAYGHALLVKLGLVALALACAAGTVIFLVAEGGRRRVALVVGVEAAVLCGAVLAASWTGATNPASATVWSPAPTRAPTEGVLSQIAADLVITVDLGPGQPGRNFVTVGVLDTRRPAPAPVTSVRVGVAGEPPLAAVPQGGVDWVSTTSIGAEGATPVVVTVQRPGERTVTATFTWVVAPMSGTRLGGAPLVPLLLWLGLAIGLLTALALVGLGVVRRLHVVAPAQPAHGERTPDGRQVERDESEGDRRGDGDRARHADRL